MLPLVATRTIHGITWTDPLAWMENMDSKSWSELIKKHQKRWAETIKPLKKEITQIAKELEDSKQESQEMLFGTEEVSVGHSGTVHFTWKWNKAQKKIYSAADLEIGNGFVWTSEEADDSGSESYKICCYTKESKNPLWEVKGVGPFVSVIGDRCYCLEVKNRLVYYKLVSYNAFTGKDKQVHYEEEDYRYNLELTKGYLRRQAGAKQDIFEISEKGIVVLEGIDLESRRFVLGSYPREYFVWDRHGWKIKNSKCILPKKLDSPESFNSKKGFLVTKSKGIRTLWKISSNKSPVICWRGIGQIMLDPFGGDYIRITQPGSEVLWWNTKEKIHSINNNTVKLLDPAGAVANKQFKLPVWLKSSLGVPYILVEPTTNQLEGLLVVGYGAYGLSTGLSTARWEPLLKRGWCIVIALLPGGGDDSPEWEDKGRLKGREFVLDCAESVIKDAQKQIKVSKEKTVLYGRSAGGLWAGGLAAKYGKGELFKGVYMEVPYLDVLQTTTNRTLPLTNIETDEFGLPEQRLSNFATMLNWSPMELVSNKITSGIFQIVRTGLNDSEVFTYEAVKWAERTGPTTLLAVEENQGHFVSGPIGNLQQAEDLSILLQKISDA
jgi:hypothetical protein